MPQGHCLVECPDWLPRHRRREPPTQQLPRQRLCRPAVGPWRRPGAATRRGRDDNTFLGRSRPPSPPRSCRGRPARDHRRSRRGAGDAPRRGPDLSPLPATAAARTPTRGGSDVAGWTTAAAAGWTWAAVRRTRSTAAVRTRLSLSRGRGRWEFSRCNGTAS